MKNPAPKLGIVLWCIEGEQDDTGDREELGDQGKANVEDGITLVDILDFYEEASSK